MTCMIIYGRSRTTTIYKYDNAREPNNRECTHDYVWLIGLGGPNQQATQKS